MRAGITSTCVVALGLACACGGSTNESGTAHDAPGVGGSAGSDGNSATGGVPDGNAGALGNAGGPSGSGGSSAGAGGANQAGAPSGSAGAGGASETGGAGANTGGSAGGTAIECDDGTGWNLDWQQWECDVVAAINEQRAMEHDCDGVTPAVPAVLRNQQLTEVARAHAQDMAEMGIVSYTNSDGEQFPYWVCSGGFTGSVVTTLIGGGSGAGGAGGASGAAGASGAQADVAQFIDGVMGFPDNCQVVMTSGASVMGVGYFDGYFVAIFATLAPSSWC